MARSDFLPRTDVLTRLLGALKRSHGPLLKTQLQQAAGVNYTVFTRYLEFLLERQLASLIIGVSVGERIELTPKGERAYDYLSSGLAEILGQVFRDRIAPRWTEDGFRPGHDSV